MRLFIACEVTGEAKEELVSLQRQLPDARMTLPRHFHLTLKFLGDVSEEAAGLVRQKLKNKQNTSLNKHNFCLKSLDVFTPHNVRVVWAGISPEEPLIELQKQIDEALADLFPRDERFKPHLTIARVKSLRDRKTFLEKISQIKLREICFTLDRFCLVESVLTPEGPEYKVLEEYLLA